MNHRIGTHHSQLTKDKMSKSHKGKTITKEVRDKMRMGHLNKSLSNSHKENISNGLKGRFKGRILSSKWKDKISKSKMGKKRSLESVNKGSKKLIGRHYSEEHRLNISKSLTGKHLSEEHKSKIRNTKIGKKLSIETRAKLSKIMRGKNTWTKGTHRSLEVKMSIAKKLSGKNSHFWNGGLSKEPYSIDWTKTLRQAIRERDKYTCQICGLKQADTAHAVHHIDYNKKNCNNNNLITLCRRCHVITNINRIYWKKYFNSILKEFENQINNKKEEQ